MMISLWGCVRSALSSNCLVCKCVCVCRCCCGTFDCRQTECCAIHILIHATTFRKFRLVCVCVFAFFPFLSICISLARVPAIHHSVCMGCCLYIMYVKISFILVCLPKQTAFFANARVLSFHFHSLLFSIQCQSFRLSERLELVVGRFVVTVKGKCVYNKRYIGIRTHIVYIRFER